jgi:hypothetical protein
MLPTHRIYGAATSSLVVALISVSEGADPVQDKILGAMRDRQTAVKTAKAVVEERILLTGPLTLPRKPIEDGGSDLKPRTNVIVLKEMKMFRKLSGPVWSYPTQSEALEVMTSVFDGEAAKSLHVTEKRSVAFIHSKRQHADRHSLHVLPIVGHFRALAEEMTVLSPEKWHVVATDAELDDAVCVMVREGSEDDIRYRELWFDAEKGYALVRRRDVFQRRTANEISISYTPDDTVGWVPSGWQINRYADGRLIDHSVATIARLTINEPVDDATFQLDFPPGTKVNHPPPPRPEVKRP